MAENRPRHDVEMKGWLMKWTNYIKGYQRRWFVLSNGLLSYYRLVHFWHVYSEKFHVNLDIMHFLKLCFLIKVLGSLNLELNQHFG